MNKFCILLSLMLSVSAYAHGSHSDEVEVRILAAQLTEGMDKVCLVDSDNNESEVFLLPTNNLSVPLKWSSRTLSVISVPERKTLVKAQLPEAGDSFIVLLIPSSEHDYSVEVLSFDQSEFQVGCFYLYNNSKKTVFGQIGSNNFQLDPGKGDILRPSSTEAKRYYDVSLSVKDTERDQRISSTRWPKQRNTRSYVFFYEHPKTMRVSFHGVDEFVVPKKQL